LSDGRLAAPVRRGVHHGLLTDGGATIYNPASPFDATAGRIAGW